LENDRTNPNLSYPERVWSLSNPLTHQEVTFNFNKETVGMGILNCTNDSFSLPIEQRGKEINYGYLQNKAKSFQASGFKIVDIGGMLREKRLELITFNKKENQQDLEQK